MALEGLDTIGWSELKTAHGDGSELPAHLRALRSADAEERKQARWAIYGAVFQQGTRFQAAIQVIPFLYELVGDPETPERGPLLQLILHLGLGYEDAHLPVGISSHELQAALAQLEQGMSPAETAQCQEIGVGPVVDWGCYETAAFQALELLPLLGDEDPLVRQMSAYLLAWFPGEGCTICPALEARLPEEPAPRQRANLLLALGLQAQQSHHEVEAALLRDRIDDEALVVRVAAAIALAPSELDDRVLAVLLEGSGEVEALAAEGLTWNAGDLAGLAGLVLAIHGRPQRERVAPALAAALAGADPGRGLDLTQALLHLVRPEDEAGFQGKGGAEFNETTRAALAAIADHGPWTLADPAGGEVPFGEYSQMLADYGLPASADELRALLPAAS